MKHITVALATVALALVAAPALATSPHTVDPAGMTPTLNPDYAPWTCVLAGTGITCTGYEDLSYTNEGTDFQCNGRSSTSPALNAPSSFDGTTSRGRALKTSIQTNFTADRLTLSPTGEGAAVFLSGDWHKHYVYPVPVT